MGARTVVVLFVVAVLLSGYVYLFERDTVFDPAIGAAFPGLQYADLEEIELRHGAFAEAPGVPSGPIVLKREKDGERLWWLEKPHVPAFNPRAESIGYSLADLQIISQVPPGTGEKVFDARGPEVTVRFRTRSGKEHRVEMGKDHPDLDLTYARITSGDGDRLVLVRRSFGKNLDSGLDDLRGRALFPVPRDRVVKLEVSGEPRYQKVVVREGGRENWRFQRPEPAAGSREAIAKALDDLNSWRAETFVRDEEGDLAPYGLDRPRTTIAVTDLQGKRTALQIGSDAPQKGQVYVKWADQPMVMTAPAGPAEALERPAEHLYSEFAIQLGAEEIVEVAVKKCGSLEVEEFTLRRGEPGAAGGTSPATSRGAKGKAARAAGGKAAPLSPGEWRVEAAGGARFDGDADRIHLVVDGLGHLLVKKYLAAESGPPAGKAPVLRVEILTDTGLRRILTLARGDTPQEEAEKIGYASVEGEPFSFQIISPIPEDLRKGAMWFRNRRISALNPEELRELEVSIPGPEGITSWVLGRPAEFWQLHIGDRFRLKDKKSIDESLVRKVVRLLGREEFRAEDWISGEKDFASREIANERFRVRVSLFNLGSNYPGFQRLFLGSRQGEGGAEGGTWARCDAPGLTELAFILDRATAGAIHDLVEHLQAVTEPAR